MSKLIVHPKNISLLSAYFEMCCHLTEYYQLKRLANDDSLDLNRVTITTMLICFLFAVIYVDFIQECISESNRALGDFNWCVPLSFTNPEILLQPCCRHSSSH